MALSRWRSSPPNSARSASWRCSISNDLAGSGRGQKWLTSANVTMPAGQRLRDLRGHDRRRRGVQVEMAVDLPGLRGRHRFPGETSAGLPLHERNGANLSAEPGPVPPTARNQALLQLPGLRVHVQACRGGPLWLRHATGRGAGASVPASRRRREGSAGQSGRNRVAVDDACRRKGLGRRRRFGTVRSGNRGRFPAGCIEAGDAGAAKGEDENKD